MKGWHLILFGEEEKTYIFMPILHVFLRTNLRSSSHLEIHHNYAEVCFHSGVTRLYNNMEGNSREAHIWEDSFHLNLNIYFHLVSWASTGCKICPEPFLMLLRAHYE